METEITSRSILDKVYHIKKGLQKQYPIIRMGVFGSVARNEITETSDIDIVVELDSKDLFDLIAIKQVLEETLKRRVDIVRLRNRMNPLLLKRIEQDVIYV